VPLVVQITPANVPDQSQLPALLDARPAVRGPRGRPRRNPEAILGDRAYGTKAMVRLVEGLGIESMLAERSDDTHGSGLGVLRYVVERTLACFSHFRRLRLCYERNGGHFQAFHDLAACLLVCTRLKSLRTQL
jgi:transposase